MATRGERNVYPFAPNNSISIQRRKVRETKSRKCSAVRVEEKCPTQTTRFRTLIGRSQRVRKPDLRPDRLVTPKVVGGRRNSIQTTGKLDKSKRKGWACLSFIIFFDKK